MNNELEQLRGQIDQIYDKIIALFKERMQVSDKIALVKKEHDMPTLAPGRERAVLARVAEEAGEEFADYTESLFRTIMAASRSYQNIRSGKKSAVYESVKEALENTPQLFPQRAMVACQGIEGAYSQIACDSIFKSPSIMYFKSFDNVFKAVESGMCQYGILPIENSTAGSVNTIYDLMLRHNFSIVRSARLKVSHNLLAKYGTKLSDVKEIFSHEQAINQCAAFLAGMKGVKVTVVENTAVAAKMVAESGDPGVAALSSRFCAEHYGLQTLQANVQDQDNNYTRFICITKDPIIYAGANRISLIIACDNKPGALYEILSKLAALGINMTKLESCPVTGRNFEFIFFLELEASVHEPGVLPMLEELERSCANFQFLGSYAEV